MNPAMVFNFVSGQGTDSSEKGRVMWARPLFPLLRKSKNITTTTKLGLAMINTLLHTTNFVHLDNAGINQLAAL